MNHFSNLAFFLWALAISTGCSLERPNPHYTPPSDETFEGAEPFVGHTPGSDSTAPAEPPGDIGLPFEDAGEFAPDANVAPDMGDPAFLGDVRVLPEPLVSNFGDRNPCTWDVCENGRCTHPPRTGAEDENEGSIQGALVLGDGSFAFTGSLGPRGSEQMVTRTLSAHTAHRQELGGGVGTALHLLDGGYAALGSAGPETFRLVVQTEEGVSPDMGNDEEGIPHGFILHPEGFLVLVETPGQAHSVRLISPTEGLLEWGPLDGEDRPSHIVKTSEGFAIAGASRDTPNEAWVRKYTLEGAFLGETKVLAHNAASSPRVIAPTAGGGLILISPHTAMTSWDLVSRVSLLSGDGDEIWTTTLGLRDDEEHPEGVLRENRDYRAAVATSEGIYVGGRVVTATSNAEGGSTTDHMMTIALLNAKGEIQKEWRWGSTQGQIWLGTSRVQHIEALPDGGLLVTGQHRGRGFWQVFDREGLCE